MNFPFGRVGGVPVEKQPRKTDAFEPSDPAGGGPIPPLDHDAVQSCLFRIEAIYGFLEDWRQATPVSPRHALVLGEEAVPFVGFNPWFPGDYPHLPYSPCFWRATILSAEVLRLTRDRRGEPALQGFRSRYLLPTRLVSEQFYRWKMAEATADTDEVQRAMQKLVLGFELAEIRLPKRPAAGEAFFQEAVRRGSQLATQGLEAWQRCMPAR